jgi:Putative zinc-finger
MTCKAPISWEELVRYWAGDLTASEVDRLDEHLMGCAACSAESARVAAVAQAVRTFIPPVLTHETLGHLRAQGVRIQEDDFLPGQRKGALFPANVDLLVLRLTGLDLSQAKQVGITVRAESTNQMLTDEPNVPFGADGVLVACQRHFVNAPHDILFEVRALSASGAEQSAIYFVPHVFE